IDEKLTPEALEWITKSSLSFSLHGKQKIVVLSPSSESRNKLLALLKVIEQEARKVNLHLEAPLVYLLSERFMRRRSSKTSSKKQVELVKDLRVNIEKESVEDAQIVEQIGDQIRESKLIPELKNFDVDYISYSGRTVSYAQQGDGLKALTGLMWYLKHFPSIILLDEPDKYMHPGYLIQLVKYIKKIAQERGVQFIIVSHNVNFIDAWFDAEITDKFMEDELQVIYMEQYKGSSLPNIYSYQDAKELIEKLNKDLRGV
ncbi:AAA family ATPase, partial [Candidatus Micrarchaeota archaeon]|nr:AAA family ATPase [Candidatus Micrarchaeota archaeon]